MVQNALDWVGMVEVGVFDHMEVVFDGGTENKRAIV